MGTRALTWTINEPDGTPWANGVVKAELLEGFTTSTEVYPAKEITFTSEADGTQPTGAAVGVPDTGTAHYKITKPNGSWFKRYIAAGAPVDLVELETIAGSSVDQDAVQTLLGAAERVLVTNVSALYQALVTDQYLYCTGTTYTVTLPTAVYGTNKALTIDSAASGNITVDGYGAETINGASTLVIVPGERRVFVPIATGAWRA